MFLWFLAADKAPCGIMLIQQIMWAAPLFYYLLSVHSFLYFHILVSVHLFYYLFIVFYISIFLFQCPFSITPSWFSIFLYSCYSAPFPLYLHSFYISIFLFQRPFSILHSFLYSSFSAPFPLSLNNVVSSIFSLSCRHNLNSSHEAWSNFFLNKRSKNSVLDLSELMWGF